MPLAPHNSIIPAVTFQEHDHSYTSWKGIRYTSCTTLIGKYHEKFDADFRAPRYAKKMYAQREHPDWIPEWKNPQYWKDKWNKKNLVSTTRGSAFHLKRELEDLALTGQTTSNREGYNYSQDYDLLPKRTWLTELLLHDEYWEIAGQVDRTWVEEEWFDIQDYKTNEKLDMVSYCKETPNALSSLGLGEPTREYKMMYFPLNHLQDCNYIHYCVQLSIYAYMMERSTGKKCRTLTLLYHKPLSETEVDPIAVEYEVPYLREEVELLLQHHFNKPLPND